MAIRTKTDTSMASSLEPFKDGRID
jgi:hypothetical protein